VVVRSPIALLAVVVVAAVVGCGASDEVEARKTVDQFIRAIEDGDEQAACELLAAEIDCSRVEQAAFEATWVGDIGGSDIRDVVLEGNEGRIMIEDTSGTDTTLRIIKLDGEWRVRP
jgi:hypothetical protein